MKPALSAGRVQSVAVRLIVEREREIHAFQTEAAYRITAVFLVPDTDGKLVEMKAELARRIKTKEEAKAFLNACQGASFAIERYYYPPGQENTSCSIHNIYVATGSRTQTGIYRSADHDARATLIRIGDSSLICVRTLSTFRNLQRLAVKTLSSK